MLKNFIQRMCQKILGFHRYLFLFSLFKIKSIQLRVNEKAFRHFVTMITDEGAILDIGANIGIMSVLLAKKCPSSTVFAFEPIPQNLHALQRVVKHFQLHNIHIHPFALGDKNCDVTMLMPIYKQVKMQGLSHVIEKDNSKESGLFFTVKMRKMDDMVALQRLPKIAAIKIDVENFEYYVLKGGVELITKQKPLVYCELWNDERRMWCIELMRNLGYKVAIFKNSKLVDFTGQPAINFFFTPL